MVAVGLRVIQEKLELRTGIIVKISSLHLSPARPLGVPGRTCFCRSALTKRGEYGLKGKAKEGEEKDRGTLGSAPSGSREAW